jgi:hypothetical protein
MRRIPGLVLLILPLFIVAQCGLERGLEIWSTPSLPSSQSTGVFSFYTQTDHVDDTLTPSRLFLGYELYYKISSIDDFPINLTETNALEAAGFKRMRLSTDIWDPTVQVTDPVISTGPLSVGEGVFYQINLDFNILPNGVQEAQASVDPSAPMTYWGPLELRRDVHDTADEENYGNYKRFSEFYPGDPDIDSADTELVNRIANATDPTIPVPVYIAVYVYAYGKSLYNSSLWQDIKSQLRYLPAQEISIYVNDGN